MPLVHGAANAAGSHVVGRADYAAVRLRAAAVLLVTEPVDPAELEGGPDGAVHGDPEVGDEQAGAARQEHRVEADRSEPVRHMSPHPELQERAADALPHAHGRAAVQVQDLRARLHDEGQPEDAHGRAPRQAARAHDAPVPRVSQAVHERARAAAARAHAHRRAAEGLRPARRHARRVGCHELHGALPRLPLPAAAARRPPAAPHGRRRRARPEEAEDGRTPRGSRERPRGEGRLCDAGETTRVRGRVEPRGVVSRGQCQRGQQ